LAEPGIKLSQSKVTQTIDLNEVVGSDISADEVLVTKIGQAIIDYMEERVEDGLGLNRVKLKSPYSKSYSESLDFVAAGKSRNDVNMKLSGDMMGSIDLIKTDGSVITIGIDDEAQAVKAYGHQTGFKGHPTLDSPKNKRPFFGVTNKELKDYVLKEFKDEIAAKKVTSAEETNRLINFIRGIRTLGDLLE
jgi:hypothetical protein